jgi:hypothetical protein
MEMIETAGNEPSPSLGDEVTLAKAVEATGVSDKTLRRWLTKGTVQGRQVDSPNGLKWLVSLSNVKEVAAQKALGLDKVTPHSPVVIIDDQPDHPGQMLVPRQDWERAIAQMANVVDLAGELGEAKEAKGRAEVKA